MKRTAAALGIVLMLAVAPAAAQEDNFKKTEKGFGELLRGMGQELQKLGGSLVGGTKKDADKDADKDVKKDAKKPAEGAK